MDFLEVQQLLGGLKGLAFVLTSSAAFGWDRNNFLRQTGADCYPTTIGNSYKVSNVRQVNDIPERSDVTTFESFELRI